MEVKKLTGKKAWRVSFETANKIPYTIIINWKTEEMEELYEKEGV